MNFLVDVNLPKKFRFFNKPEFSFVADIQTTLPDTEIWQYALRNNLVILTKGSDFYDRSLVARQRPKVVHFRLGNQTLAGLHNYFSIYWSEIMLLLSEHDLLVAHTDRIDTVL